MSATVAYNYCSLLWGGQYAGYSTLPETAFLYAIPFAIGIVICVILAIVFRRKENKYSGRIWI